MPRWYCGMTTELADGQQQLEALGIPSWLARRAIAAYPNDVARAADFAFETSASRRKAACVREPVSPRCLEQTFDLTDDGVLAMVTVQSRSSVACCIKGLRIPETEHLLTDHVAFGFSALPMFFPECVAKGSRFTVGGLGVEMCSRCAVFY